MDKGDKDSCLGWREDGGMLGDQTYPGHSWFCSFFCHQQSCYAQTHLFFSDLINMSVLLSSATSGWFISAAQSASLLLDIMRSYCVERLTLNIRFKHVAVIGWFYLTCSALTGLFLSFIWRKCWSRSEQPAVFIHCEEIISKQPNSHWTRVTLKTTETKRVELIGRQLWLTAL